MTRRSAARLGWHGRDDMPMVPLNSIVISAPNLLSGAWLAVAMLWCFNPNISRKRPKIGRSAGAETAEGDRGVLFSTSQGAFGRLCPAICPRFGRIS
jgi:hypothetical protein